MAIYNEPNTTAPSYATGGHGGIGHNNVTGLKSILQSYGIDATSLNVHDISMHMLRTADFDVFMMPDNLPRENITNLVKDFWLSGGGILAFDSSGLFLCYMGILPPESAGSDGYSTYWVYSGQDVNITTRNPVSKSYPLGNVTPTDSGYSYFVWKWSALSGSSIAADLTKVARARSSPDYVSVLAFTPSTQGGKVVTIAADLTHEYIPKLHRMYADAADWLCPRPKARILYDLTHVPWYGVDLWDGKYVNYSTDPKYYTWRDGLVSRSYTFDKLYPSATGNLTLANLGPYNVLVIAMPSRNFTASEVSAVADWIAAGGSLLVLGDNSGLKIQNANINYLLSPYNLRMNMTVSPTGPNFTVFQKHAICEGLSSIATSSPGAVNLTSPAYPIVGDTHGNTIVAGQIHGQGRILLQSDLNVFDHALISSGSDRQYSVNIINWLASGGTNVLLFTDEPDSTNYYRTPVADALNDLRVPFYLVFTASYLNFSLYSRAWSFVIFDNPWTDTTIALTAIANHVASGGKLIMSSYRVDSQPLNHLWALLGFAYANDQPNKVPLCIWQPGNPIFNLPNKYGATKFVPTRDYGDEGDLLMTFGNATSLAGNATTATTNKTNIVLRNDGKTLYNGYLIDQFKADYDNSSYKDNFELWENEIAFMLSPTIDSPSDIHYVVGATGNSIVWHPLSGRPFNYSLTINGSDAGIGPWAGSAITLNVDGLSVGNHTCLLKVWDNAGYSVSDSVLVTVTAMTTTPEGLSPTVIILIVAAAAIIVVLLVVFMRRGKK